MNIIGILLIISIIVINISWFFGNIKYEDAFLSTIKGYKYESVWDLLITILFVIVFLPALLIESTIKYVL